MPQGSWAGSTKHWKGLADASSTSIILFTVLSGLGLGLIVWIGLGFGPDAPAHAWAGSGLAIVISGVGGLMSSLHLGKPSNAWRAFSQWRSSWLSREACLLVATLGVFGLYAAFWCLGGVRVLALGLVAAVLAVATIYSTAMIYAQIRAVPRWSLTPTPLLFVVVAFAGGLLAHQSIVALTGGQAQIWLSLAALATASACALWWDSKARDIRRDSTGASLGSATGLGRIGAVRLFEAPHTGSNYLLNEMAYKVGRHRAEQLRKVGFGAGFALPLLFALLAMVAGRGWLVLVSGFIGRSSRGLRRLRVAGLSSRQSVQDGDEQGFVWTG